MSQEPPLVSVIIPALNEERDIAGCIESIVRQDYPLDRCQVIVVDGASSDRTAELAARCIVGAGFHSAKVLTNPGRRTSSSLNVGLRAADGSIILRLDARSRIQPHYIGTCVGLLLSRPEVGVVGGRQLALARDGAGIVASGIARALRNRYATGLSRYRLAHRSGPSDTVWMGSFRADELRQRGGWDETVALNEDFALNESFRQAGFIVWLDVSLRTGYLARDSMTAIAGQHFRYGRVKCIGWARGRRPLARQGALMALPPAVGLALLWARRRSLLGPFVALPLALGAIDHFGSDESAPLAERCSAIGAICVLGVSWWLGVAVGWGSERLGIDHELA